ncbi:hypothetical protein Forpe1208_v015645 [Fusarium oxysporum f. sp. rapae]|uniref:DUF7703 domain-containing protein n=1 Tax=Fusarium oxysporum f. sp. rapae TaxID=485398 RepID=A0A8J5NL59_FUSOX|nr:hypothetical protein Forpe1208_v015645 [Fusarium oxysporum f. sp. rapae]
MTTGEGYRGGVDVTISIAMTMAAFFGISLYNVIEIHVQIFLQFRKRTGLYFWSLIWASWGIAIHSIGFLLQFFQISRNSYTNITIITIGGVSMVIGQSVVLYSRLHLVVDDRRKIRWILKMIILSFFLFTVPPTVMNYGSNSSHPQPFLRPFEIYEKIMLFGFATQELIISSLYMWETRKMLRLITPNSSDTARRVMKHLIYINILIILMDISIIGTELGGAHAIQTTYKSAVYGVKLKLEFPVLNQLRAIVKRGGCSCNCSRPQISFITDEAMTPRPGYELVPRRHSSTTNTFLSTHQPSVSSGLNLAPSFQPIKLGSHNNKSRLIRNQALGRPRDYAAGSS